MPIKFDESIQKHVRVDGGPGSGRKGHGGAPGQKVVKGYKSGMVTHHTRGSTHTAFRFVSKEHAERYGKEHDLKGVKAEPRGPDGSHVLRVGKLYLQAHKN